MSKPVITKAERRKEPRKPINLIKSPKVVEILASLDSTEIILPKPLSTGTIGIPVISEAELRRRRDIGHY